MNPFNFGIKKIEYQNVNQAEKAAMNMSVWEGLRIGIVRFLKEDLHSLIFWFIFLYMLGSSLIRFV